MTLLASIRRLGLPLIIASQAVFVLQAAAAADEAAIVVAVQNSSQTALERSFAKETIRFLSDSNYDRSIVFKKLPLDQITKLAQERKIDFALLGPDAYAAMEIHFGAHALCSQRLISDESKKVSGAAVLISADNKNIRELSDLTRVAVSKDESRAFFVKAFKRELLQLDSDADRGKNISIELFSQSETQLLDLLLSGQISALLLPAGALEKLKSSDASAAKLLKVVGETSPNPILASSSSLYPGLTFAAFPSADSETAARLTASLLGMPTADGYDWSLPTTFEFVHELLSVIRDADYLKRPDQSLLTLLKEYWMYLCFALLAVLALIIHSLRTEVLVKRRTAQLTLALKEREAMKEEVNAYIKRLAYMERIGMVGEISSMLAHELKQPLAVIHNYARAITRMLAKDIVPDRPTMGSVIDKIDDQCDKAAKIIDHVRSYTKDKEKTKTVLDLSQLSLLAVQNFKILFNLDVQHEIEPNVRIVGNPLEAELLLNNLLKNAMEAGEENSEPQVKLIVRSSGSNALIEISDNGPLLTDEELASIGVPLQSRKANGLGLGLVIVQRIVESARGKIQFLRNSPCGVRVIVTWPLSQNNPNEKE